MCVGCCFVVFFRFCNGHRNNALRNHVADKWVLLSHSWLGLLKGIATLHYTTTHYYTAPTPNTQRTNNRYTTNLTNYTNKYTTLHNTTHYYTASTPDTPNHSTTLNHSTALNSNYTLITGTHDQLNSNYTTTQTRHTHTLLSTYYNYQPTLLHKQTTRRHTQTTQVQCGLIIGTHQPTPTTLPHHYKQTSLYCSSCCSWFVVVCSNNTSGGFIHDLVYYYTTQHYTNKHTRLLHYTNKHTPLALIIVNQHYTTLTSQPTGQWWELCILFVMG